MPIFHVRNVPDDLYARIQQLASNQNRSMSAQVVQLLDQALRAEEARQSQARILAGIRRRRVAYAKNPSAPDSVALLREDRRR
jgi:plasmid stability protein